MARDKEAQPHRGGGQGKKRPFQVGPRLAKGAYTGHAQRIKKTLIHKAKVKKEYAKALKEAGYSSDPRQKGPRADDDGDEVEMDQGPVIDERAEEEEKERLRRRLYGDDDASDDNEQSDESEDEFARDRKANLSNRRQRGTTSDSDSDSDSPSPEPESRPPPAPRSREPLPSQSSAAKDGSKRAPTKRNPAPPAPRSGPKANSTPPAAQQQHAKPKRPKLTEQEIEKIREKKRFEKREAGRKTRTGQAKLGAKMEGLLGKIQRSLAN
ncbi:hypothetical protein JCM3766R1_003715 [Sporobolomyces carnicolor]